MEEYRIIIAGSGGQGVLFAGELLVEAAMKSGFNVSVIPSYGPEMRGGTANSMLILSKKEIYSPIIDIINVLISLNLPSLERFLSRIEDKGLIIHNSSLGESKKDLRKYKYFGLPLSDKSLELGNIRVANIMSLGAVNKILNLFKEEYFTETLKHRFGETKQNLIDLNLQAFDVGKELIK